MAVTLVSQTFWTCGLPLKHRNLRIPCGCMDIPRVSRARLHPGTQHHLHDCEWYVQEEYTCAHVQYVPLANTTAISSRKSSRPLLVYRPSRPESLSRDQTGHEHGSFLLNAHDRCGARHRRNGENPVNLHRHWSPATLDKMSVEQ